MLEFATVQLILGAASGIAGLGFLVAGSGAPIRLVGSGLVLIGAVCSWDALVARGHGSTLGGPRLETFERQPGDREVGPAPGDEIGDDGPADRPELEPVARIAEAVDDPFRGNGAAQYWQMVDGFRLYAAPASYQAHAAHHGK